MYVCLYECMHVLTYVCTYVCKYTRVYAGGMFKKYSDWNCSGCSMDGMCLQPVLTCSYMS